MTQFPDRTEAPAVTPFGPLALPEADTVIHTSGIPVHVFDRGSDEICRITIIWPGGESDTTFCGRAALSMQAIREGSADISPIEMADLLDFNSARLSTSSLKHSSFIRLTCANGRIQNVLPAIMQCVRHPAMPLKNINVNIENAAVSAGIALQQVATQATRLGASLIFGKSHPVNNVATPEKLRSLSREDLMATQASICNRMPAIYAAGRISAQLLDRIMSSIDILMYNKPGTADSPGFHPMRPEKAGVRTIEVEGALQSAICTNIPAVGRDNPDYHALRTTVIALGGYFGSRLMTNIREEKGYTYGIHAALASDPEGAYITISSQQDTSYTQAVIDETVSEINRLRDTLMKPDELERLRSHAMSELATVLDTPFSISEYRMCELTEGMPHDYYHKLQNTVRSISAKDIREMARKYIDPEQMRIAIATSSTAVS